MRPATTAGPTLLAVGQPQATYAHVGYGVLHFAAAAGEYRPAVPHTPEATVLLALVLLAHGRRRGQPIGEVVRRLLPALLEGLAVAAVVRPVARFLLLVSMIDAPPVSWPPGLAMWIITLVPLVAWVAHQRDAVGRVAVGAAAIIVAGLLAPVQHVIKPALLSDLVQMERLAAATEAQAVRLGRWPTVAEWQAEQGQPVGVDGTRFAYLPPVRPASSPGGVASAEPALGARDPAAPDWQQYTISAQPVGEGAGFRCFASRDFGPDGLFASPDDRLRYHLRPGLYGRTSWPHGRAPRDPQVKLPPWPAAAKGATP